MSVTIDLREFNQALKQYAVAGKKTMAEASNKKIVDVLLTAAKNTPVANATSIPAAGQYKLIAYLLGGGYTRAQAARFEQRVLRFRKSAIKFLRSYFVAAANAVRGIPSKRRGVAAHAIRATQNKPNIAVESSYDYKDLKSRRWTNANRTAAQAERMLKRILDRAIIAQIADMQVYITRKLGGTAAKYSGAK